MDPPECSGHSHDHDHTDDLGLSLRQYMDIPRVTCLNEVVAGSGRDILKFHEDRLSSSPSLQSPSDDPELLLTIPFTEAVTVQSICIRASSSNGAAPRNIRLFTNREDLDFEMMHDELPPQQVLELLPPDHMPDAGTIDYPCRPAGRFQNISALSIFVENNYSIADDDDDDDDDDDECGGTEITYIGLKGKGTKAKRMIVEAVYEAQGMPKDHKVPGDELADHNII